MNRTRSLAAAISVLALVAAGCSSTVVQGLAVSPVYDAFRAGGLPAQDGPSGIKDGAPAPDGDVQNTDNGKIDELSLLAVNDIAEFWEKNYSEDLQGTFTPIKKFLSWDSDDPSSPSACGNKTYGLQNAFYCPSKKLMAWDRGELVPTGQKYFGDAAVAALFAHEYGHAVQDQANIVDDNTPTIVSEQQADCFSGTYIRWVAEGQSPRFRMSTGDGLNHVLAAVITLRDPVLGAQEQQQTADQEHGSAMDRISAFQIGFTSGASECAKIDAAEIKERRGDLPQSLPEDRNGDVQSGDVEITEDILTQLMDTLGAVYKLNDPPKLSFDQPTCSDARPSEPASYCPSSNTIFADVSALADLGKPADIKDKMLVKGDDTAVSAFTSRYALATQHEKGEKLDTPAAALRTACLTGWAQAAMAEPITLPDGKVPLTLAAGDLDEAVAGLLTSGFVASNVNAETVPSGFTRIVAFRSGLGGDSDLCYERFK
jgi:predicted metalloprotease